MARKYTTPKNVEEVRHRAWKTRRAKYGARGHNGAYSRPCSTCRQMASVLVCLHIEGILSEGQAAKAIGVGRVELRKLADKAMNLTSAQATVLGRAIMRSALTTTQEDTR